MKQTLLRTLALWLLVLPLGLGAQIRNAVSVTANPPAGPLRVGQVVTLTFKAQIKPGYHIYSAIVPDPPANLPTSLALDEESRGVELVGTLQDVGKPHKEFDKVFEAEVAWFEREASFTQRVRITAPDAVLRGYLSYQVCDTSLCIPGQYNFNWMLTAAPAGNAKSAPVAESAAPPTAATPAAPAPQPAAIDTPATAPTSGPAPDTAQPTANVAESPASEGLGWLFLQAFAFGLVGLLTPCVFPMIPLTVSYFTKRASSRAEGLKGAFLYAGSIVFIFVVLGLLITVLFGSAAIYQLSTNPWVNLAFFVLLVVFALSFLGWFDITLPSSWTNQTDRRSDQGGVIGIFFMAFTLVLVSFSCTGPLVGTLLVSAAGGSYLAPIVGMLGFSLAFAIPFGAFALFPKALDALPRSGDWLNRVKVVLGFLELALALKFLSNADLVWHLGILDREVYLAGWIVIFTLTGIYLMGGFRLPHDSPRPDGGEKIGVPRLLLAIGSFWFVLYLVPGLWGAPLPGVSNFLPPVNDDIGVKPAGYAGASFGSGSPVAALCETPRSYREKLAKSTPPGFCAFYDLAEAQAYARMVNKPIFIDFTGHTCVNCRHMEANVWPDPEVKRRLTQDYVMLQLYVDDLTKLPQPIDLPDGRRLRTIGDQNLYLQETRYNTNAQPLYVLVDADLNQLVAPRAFDLDVPAYIAFLDAGLQAHAARKTATATR